MEVQIENIPQEVLLEILGFLPNVDLARSSRSCKTFRDAVLTIHQERIRKNLAKWNFSSLERPTTSNFDLMSLVVQMDNTVIPALDFKTSTRLRDEQYLCFGICSVLDLLLVITNQRILMYSLPNENDNLDESNFEYYRVGTLLLSDFELQLPEIPPSSPIAQLVIRNHVIGLSSNLFEQSVLLDASSGKLIEKVPSKSVGTAHTTCFDFLIDTTSDCETIISSIAYSSGKVQIFKSSKGDHNLHHIFVFSGGSTAIKFLVPSSRHTYTDDTLLACATLNKICICSVAKKSLLWTIPTNSSLPVFLDFSESYLVATRQNGCVEMYSQQDWCESDPSAINIRFGVNSFGAQSSEVTHATCMLYKSPKAPVDNAPEIASLRAYANGAVEMFFRESSPVRTTHGMKVAHTISQAVGVCMLSMNVNMLVLANNTSSLQKCSLL